MLSIASINVNGLRSAAKKGLFPWLTKRQFDVICIQELKAQEHQLEDADFHLDGYHRYLFPAERPGYSGVALYSKVKPKTVKTGLGFGQADTEGRYIEADYGTAKVASLYLPSGSAGPERQACKDEFLELYLPILKKKAKEATPYIVVGDYNIAHKEIDLKNWKSNQKNSGFLPHERAWLDELFDKVGFVDAFREIDKRPDQYTWWSNRGQAYAKNVGWRIDYHIVSPALKGKIKRVEIYKDEKFSDHAPLILDYDLKL
jgi:exodeoxyribonuclease III